MIKRNHQAVEVLSSYAENISPGHRKFTALRINDPNTEVGAEDLNAIRKLVPKIPFDALVLPKVEDPSTVIRASRSLNDKVPFWCMIETSRGVLRAASIAELACVDTLVLGTNDLTKDLHSRHTPSREPLLFSMSMCVLAARASGKFVLDGVHIDIHDDAGLRRASTQAKELGFDGKTLIHPKQIDTTHEVFSPSQEEVDHARKVVDAWEEAKNSGKGVVLVNGRLVEELHVHEAQRILDINQYIISNE